MAGPIEDGSSILPSILHQTDQRPDHAEGRSGVAERT